VSPGGARRNGERGKLRAIPSVESLLQTPSLTELGGRVPRSVVVGAARETLAALRDSIRRGTQASAPSVETLAAETRRRAEQSLTPSLKPVINATGIILHTHLGRATLPEAAIAAVTDAARWYRKSIWRAANAAPAWPIWSRSFASSWARRRSSS